MAKNNPGLAVGDEADDLQLEQGEVAGYHVLERIGRGSVGIVYRAVQVSMQREVAFKVLEPRLAADRQFVSRFLEEARTAGAVHHPNIITCFDVGMEGALLYQALELLPNGDLNRYLRQQGCPLDKDRALAVALDCARGLEGIHAVGLCHRDIKPGNVFIADDGTAKLGDLGFARYLAGDAVPTSERLTSADRCFLAPEMVGSGRGDIRSDIYSVGALLYLMAAGSPPLVAVDERGEDWGGIDAVVPDPRTINPDLSGGVVAVIRKALDADADMRYDNPTQLREDLERVAYDFAPIHARRGTVIDSRGGRIAGSSATRPAGPILAAAGEGGEPAPPPKRDRRLWLAMVALVFIIGAALALVVMIYGEGETDPVLDPAQDDVRFAGAAVPASSDVREETAAAAQSPSSRLQVAETVPAWAADHGHDTYGDWVDLEVAGERLRMRWCPPGSLVMGSPADQTHRHNNEIEHRVTLSRGFWLSATEVPQALYQAIMHENPSTFIGPRRPVEGVTWNQCREFFAAVNQLRGEVTLRLPTEAEWEYAARSGGADPVTGLPAEAFWSDANSGRTTHPVASAGVNSWGLADMQGNVMEWCQDGFAPYPTAAVVDPLVPPASEIYRVTRGGAWSLAPQQCRPTTRHRNRPYTNLFFIGFRVACDG